MYCSSCGKKITENSKFCKYCGASQTETEGKEEKKTNKEYYETVWTCDFCKEEFKSKEESDSHELKCIQNPKNKKFLQNINPKRAWEYLWLTTVVVFFINMFIWIKYEEFNIELLNGEFLKTLFISNIGLGIISFLALIVSSNKPKNNRVSMFVKNSLIICFFYLLINSLVFAVEGNSAKNDESYRNKYYSGTTPTPVPTIEVKITSTVTPKKTVKTNNTQNTNTKTNTNQGNQIDCTGPDGVVFKTTQVECEKFNSAWGYKKPTPTLNPREWIKCPISANCGGGNKEMTREECRRMICCETNSGWILTSDDVCNSTQHKESYNDWMEFCKKLYKDESGICNSDCWKCISDYKNPYQ